MTKWSKTHKNTILTTFTNLDCFKPLMLDRTSYVIHNRIRIFADYSQVTTGGLEEKNLVKRIVNITALYFSRTLKVNRLDRLLFPASVSKMCNTLIVPDIYATQGVIGDLGLIIGN